MKCKGNILTRTLFFLGALPLILSCSNPSLNSDGIALKNYQILTLEDERILDGQVLVIKDDLILDLLPEEKFYEKYNFPDSLVVDGKGKFLMPSLNEMHAHFQPDNPSHKTYLSHFLGYGITNIRVMAGSKELLSWKDSIQQGLLLGPDLKVAGPLIETKKNKVVTKQPEDMAYYKKEMAEDPDLAKVTEVVSEIARNNVWICPTSVLWRNNTDSLRNQAVIEGEPFKRIDSGLKSWWLSTRANPGSGKEAALSGLFLKEMAKQNAKILAGTDFPMPFLVPGFSLHQEIHSLVDMGYSNLEALKSATVYPAEYWGETQKRGSVRNGSLANLIVLNKNPLEDIRNTLTIEQVILKGDFFNPTDLLKFPDNFN